LVCKIIRLRVFLQMKNHKFEKNLGT